MFDEERRASKESTSRRPGLGPAAKDGKTTKAQMPSPERFAVLKKLLERNGWRLIRITGSHHVFKKADAVDVVLPVHRGKVKPFYAKQVRQLTQQKGA